MESSRSRSNRNPPSWHHLHIHETTTQLIYCGTRRQPHTSAPGFGGKHWQEASEFMVTITILRCTPQEDGPSPYMYMLHIESIHRSYRSWATSCGCRSSSSMVIDQSTWLLSPYTLELRSGWGWPNPTAIRWLPALSWDPRQDQGTDSHPSRSLIFSSARKRHHHGNLYCVPELWGLDRHHDQRRHHCQLELSLHILCGSNMHWSCHDNAILHHARMIILPEATYGATHGAIPEHSNSQSTITKKPTKGSHRNTHTSTLSSLTMANSAMNLFGTCS